MTVHAITGLGTKNTIREDHARSMKPIEPIVAKHPEPVRISLEEKILCIKAIEAGLSVHQAPIEFNRSLSTV